MLTGIVFCTTAAAVTYKVITWIRPPRVKSPLCIALENGFFEIAEMLTAKGAVCTAKEITKLGKVYTNFKLSQKEKKKEMELEEVCTEGKDFEVHIHNEDIEEENFTESEEVHKEEEEEDIVEIEMEKEGGKGKKKGNGKMNKVDKENNKMLKRTLFLSRNLQMKKVADFTPLKILGCGNFGIVFLCGVTLGRKTYQVALKMIFNFSDQTSSTFRGENENEYKILCSLEPHPNIIHILSFYNEKPSQQLLDMALMRGTVEQALFSFNIQSGQKIPKTTLFYVTESHPYTLEQKLRELGGGIALDRIVRYSRDILDSLVFLFKHHIVHRDVKLNNVLVSEGDKIIIGDFGESITTDEFHLCKKKELRAGNPRFTAPEVINSVATAKEEDMIDFTGQYSWDAGCLIFWICFGEFPFDGYPYVEAGEVHFPEDGGRIPEEMKYLMRNLLKENKSERMRIDWAFQYFSFTIDV